MKRKETDKEKRKERRRNETKLNVRTKMWSYNLKNKGSVKDVS